jgi:hypothetical protein
MSRTPIRTSTGPTVDRAVCHRHPWHVWIANCSDCTDWHLASLRARRGGHLAGDPPARAASAA